MIKLTKMNGDEIIINADLIESIKAAPDTTICLTTNKKFIVKDNVEEIVSKVKKYRREVMSSVRIEEG